MKLNSRFKNSYDGNGGLLSCMKRNVFDIEEAQANEFLISTEPFMFVILKDDVEELKMHLKQKVMSLIFDEQWEDTGMFIVNEKKGVYIQNRIMFDALGMMKRLRYLKIVRVGQNWVLDNSTKTLIVKMFQSFHKLKLVEKFILQFDLACEHEILHPTEFLAPQLAYVHSSLRHSLRRQGVLNFETFKTHHLNIDSEMFGGITIKHYNNDVAMSIDPTHYCAETNELALPISVEALSSNDVRYFLDDVYKIRCHCTIYNLNRHQKHRVNNVDYYMDPFPKNVRNMKMAASNLVEIHNLNLRQPNQTRSWGSRTEVCFRTRGKTNDEKRRFLSHMSLLHAIKNE